MDKDGRPVVIDISTDMAVEDNMKWSIEKPTTYSWRLRIKALEIEDEGNYTCFVRLTSNNNRVEANRTVLSTGISSLKVPFKFRCYSLSAIVSNILFAVCMYFDNTAPYSYTFSRCASNS